MVITRMTARAPMPVRRALIPLFAVIVASGAPPVAAADWADPAKVLKIAFPIDVSGLDPAGTQETYASLVEGRIFDALYVWDYLARPHRFGDLFRRRPRLRRQETRIDRGGFRLRVEAHRRSARTLAQLGSARTQD